MKKFKFAYLVMLVLFFSFGCKKDDTATVYPGFTVKIDNTTWFPENYSSAFDIRQNIMKIYAGNIKVNDLIILSFIGDSTGTYNLKSGDSQTYGYFENPSKIQMYTTTLSENLAGQIIVTEFDKSFHTITGTFHFEAYSIDNLKKTFTEGKFIKIPYTIE